MPERSSSPWTGGESFYHLSNCSLSGRVCQGTACFVARHLNPERWQQAKAQAPRVYCLGKCYAAPAAASGSEAPHIEVCARQGIVLDRIARGVDPSLKACLKNQGYQALRKALRRRPEEVVAQMEASQLRGRGGAGFFTGRKWRAVFDQSSEEKWVIANADEGDPGAFIDRFVMERDPHCLIEALLVAAYAVGASRGCIYLRCEYPEAAAVLRTAIDEARAAGLLGERILDSGFRFDLELVKGQGSYVCGEETALIRSIEGLRPEPASRPPYPTQHGLHGKPTLVNNVETLAAVPWIVRNGAEAYRSLGYGYSRGTKVVSLNSLFRRPGLFEVEFGLSLRSLVEEVGGGLTDGTLKGLMIGGPLAGIVPPSLLDTRLDFEALKQIGAGVGHGGVVAFDERTSILDLARHVFSFAAYESCGKCTPCRLGSRRLEEMLRAERSEQTAETRADWTAILSALEAASLCGLGTGLAEFTRSVERHYAAELDPCFA